MDKNRSDLFKDYAREPVPDHQSRSGVQIALIYLGVAFTLPIYLLAGELSLANGFQRGMGAVLIAGVILTVIGGYMGWIGARTRLSTAMIAARVFGGQAALLINFILAATLFGWFGVTAEFFATALATHLQSLFGVQLPASVLVIFGTLLVISSAIFGFRGLQHLSKVTIPLIAALFVGLIYKLSREAGLSAVFSYTPEDLPSFGSQVSTIIGAWAVGAIILPDLTRYAGKPSDGWIAALLAFVPGLACVMALAMIPSILGNNDDPIMLLTNVGWTGFAMLVVVLSTWSTNDNNLYSAALGLAGIFKTIRKWKIVLYAGLAGGVLGMLGVTSYFITFLVWLGILIPPIGGTAIAAFIVNRASLLADQKERPFKPIACLSWLSGCLAAYFSHIQALSLTATQIAACDGILASLIVYMSCHALRTRIVKATATAR